MPYDRARKAPSTHLYDFITPYVADLGNAVDLALVKSSGVQIGVDPLGGAGRSLLGTDHRAIRHPGGNGGERRSIDPTFRFMTIDWDGRIRMDCSSPSRDGERARGALEDRFDIAFASDTDHDRHGIVTPTAGLMNPNHYLAAAIRYLFQPRGNLWPREMAVGKTVVSSGIIDRVTAGIGTPPAA